MKSAAIIGLWLVIINFFAVLANNRITLQDDTAYRWIPPSVEQGQTWNPIRLHAKWDSFWHLLIADKGYRYEPGQEQQSNIVFFPLYALSVRTVHVVAGDFILSGWIVSCIFLFLSGWMFMKLVRKFHSELDPVLALGLLLIFPTSFFLNAVYTESMFLFFSLTCLYFARSKSYLLAGIFGLFASLTRITGILLILPVVWEALGNPLGWRIRIRNAFSTLLIPLGTALFFLYHYIRFGDFLLFFKVENAWGRAFTINHDLFWTGTRVATTNLIMDGLFVLFALIATIFVWKRIRASYGLYMLATVGAVVATGSLMSIGRYILVLFPIALLGASIRHPIARSVWIFVSLLLCGFTTMLFVNNYWAG